MAKGSVNKVIILGRLGNDPDTKTTAGGLTITNLSVATTELGRKDQATGQYGPDQTEWHRCSLFGRQAENAATYLRKGSMVYLEGRLQTRKWQDQSGADRWSTEIVVNEMQFIGGQNQNAQQGGQQQQQAPGANPFAQPQQQAAPQQQPAPQGYQQPQQQAAPTQGYQQPQQQPQAQQPQPTAPQQPTGFDDFDDDIPF